MNSIDYWLPPLALIVGYWLGFARARARFGPKAVKRVRVPGTPGIDMEFALKFGALMVPAFIAIAYKAGDRKPAPHPLPEPAPPPEPRDVTPEN